MAGEISEEGAFDILPIPQMTIVSGRTPDKDLAELAARLLRALSEMATHNRHREADLAAAMHAAGLAADPPSTCLVLRLLRDQGCINKMIPLSDGGLVVTVTGAHMEQRDGARQSAGLDGA
jgi:hypothetical protein